ncbi:MAG: restriction endonuclease subunit S [Fusobacteriaceae bacterium]|nr:restriction endonuclease subunit S [Fusobacteriaceae bacterium]
MVEVKKGYKITELGVIPEDWEVKELDEIANYTKGYPFKSNDYKPNGVRIIRVSDTNADSIKNENEIYISFEEVNQYKKWSLREKDIIITTVGSKPPMYESLVGKSILVDSKNVGNLLNQNAIYIRTKNNSLDLQVLINKNLKKKDYICYIEKIIRGNANQASITVGDFMKYKIPVPKSEPEQQAIAQALSDTDSLISSLEKLIDKKKNIKQGTMQELLTGRKRVEGFSGEWEEKRLGDLFEITAGGDLDLHNFSKEKIGEYKYPVYSNAINFKGLYGYSNLYTLDLECVTVTARGTLGNANARTGKFLPIGRILVLNPLTKLDVYFFQEFINSRIKFPNESTGVPQLTAPQIRKILVKSPLLEEQQAIANILSDMYKEIEALEQKLDKYKAIKEGMMQELLTGRIRLV